MRSELVIHLSKLDGNIQALKSRLNKNVKVMAVIKDNAYGHGAVPIAKHLSSKVDWFCVATIEEGIELRNADINNPILIFEAPRLELVSNYIQFGLTATVSDLSDFEILKEGTEYQINFDTGMRRLGIPFDEREKALERFKTYSKLNCTGIYTHFASADEPHNKSVFEQLEKFKIIKKLFPDSLMAHTANTGAIFHYRDADLQFDAVRAGVCLYGYAAGETDISDLKSIVEWNSFVMQTRPIRKGESVGYGGSWIAPEDGVVGTVPVGYGDGVQRILSNKFQVKINGQKVQQVGRISMDYFGIYGSKALIGKGDKVTIFDGESLNPKQWASLANTIPYEITTSFNKKIERQYLLKK